MTVAEIKAKRRDGVSRICAKLDTTPAFLCDPLLTFALDEPSIDPIRMEVFLQRRHGMKDGESVRECLERVFGKEVADLAESLI